jgi:hypothetical protein
MKTRIATTALAALLTLSASAAFAKDSALSLVPKNAVTVGMVKLNELRTSPLSGTLFQHTDHLGANGDAADFIRETGLDPSKDIDTIVVATAPRTTLGTEADVLVIAEGRFNVERLTTAMTNHGATKKGAYFLLDKEDSDQSKQGAVAFLSAHTAVGGSEKAVIDAIAASKTAGTGFAQASALGHDLARIDANASAWLLVDVPRASRLTGGVNMPNGKEQSSQALAAAIKSVSTIGIWGIDSGDALKLGGFGVSSDGETLQLLEDTIRGALSALRLAAKDKAPEMVSVLRRFDVSRSNDTVSVSGSIPAETLKELQAKKAVAKTASK